MKIILLSALALASMIATGVAGTIPKGSKVKLELISVVNIDNDKVTTNMKPIKGVPSGLKVGKVYEFKMGGNGKLTGPKGINIGYATAGRLTQLNLSYLKIPGVSNYYLDYKASGTGNLNASIEFAAAFQDNNKGKPVAITLTYMDVKVLPKLDTKSVNLVFEVK